MSVVRAEIVHCCCTEMEILAPAGSRASLEAAVASGADAVYMGGSGFQARAFSEGVGDLTDAVSYAHTWGVDVHFTLNTVLLDREIQAFLEQAAEAIDAGADALIVADLGALDILRTMYPDIALHASTQLSIRSPQSAHAYARLGFVRLVLAREVPAAEVRTICAEACCEIEVFCHGALCVCGSGRCLMSSLLGGRSANRGACAQPCRLRYTLADKSGYFLNTHDLSLASEIDTLRNYGVASLKIEGRMKGPLYVTAAVEAYREALATGHVSDEAMDALVATFSRGGFTTGGFGNDRDRFYTAFPGHTGHLLGKVLQVRGKSVTVSTDTDVHEGDTVAPGGADQGASTVRSVRRTRAGLQLELADRLKLTPGTQLFRKSDAVIENRLRESIRAGRDKIPVTAAFLALRNTPMRLTVTLPDGVEIIKHGPVPEDARTKETSEDAVAELLARTGQTPFVISDMEIRLDRGLSIPKSAVNALRREVLDTAAAHRAERYPARKPVQPLPQLSGHLNDVRPAQVACLVENEAQALACAPYADILYVPATSNMEHIEGCTVLPVLSSMSSGEEIRRALRKWQGHPFLTGCMLPNMHGCITGADFNVTNSYALALLSSVGAARITISQELNTAQIRQLTVPDGVQTEVVAYGHQVLMLTENCPLSCDRKRCRAEHEAPALTDRTGKSFRILKDNCTSCRVRLLNSVPLWSADILEEVCCDVVRLEFTTESADQCADVCRAYRDAMSGQRIPAPEGTFTRGHLRRGLKAAK